MQTPILPIYPSEKNPSLIKELQTRLRYHGFKNLIIDGIFGRQTLFAVRAFQATHFDANSNPLYVDGIVGEHTWNALQSSQIQTHATPPSPLQRRALTIATVEVGVMELPLRSNRGPRVEQYLKSVNCPAGSPWCAAFVYWCFQQAANEICTINPLLKTAHCLSHWNKSQGHRIPSTDALPARLSSQDALPVRLPSSHLIKPGSIFITSYGGGMGHTGIVAEVNGNEILTIEGNTNLNHSREGYGVFQHTRKICDINTGFINYG
ncbi:MAG: CHAP domain-containing protein [Marinilabiliaceae bacterium]|nr:CHAP domain-containing protein [Marinilabiliaceae bacterium]